ncbi:hypothetical protein AK830_g163 [Neonectria ditissima]|uniref:Uncharacterized protein n=1 Tax=Neonectria ditissima TaxID=78410 RepID=A0A0P7C3I5_9HYPO|nr:hypothetical protein AK830_g163 [Neonectria ditissima]
MPARESAIVTGGAGGLGQAIAKKLASRGINVLIADKQEGANGHLLAAKLSREYRVDVLYQLTDVTNEDDVKRMVQVAVDRWGRLDWAANNAGISERLDDNEDSVSTAEFDAIYEINQRGTWLCQKYEAQQMRTQPRRVPNGTDPTMGGMPQRGAIANVASICGHAATGMPSYTATKHAILGITKSGGLFYGKSGVRCNSVSPGPILTDKYDEFKKAFENDARFKEQAVGWANRCPLRRASSCEEQANVVSFLLSGESSFINCSDILVDGGLTAVADQ